MIDDARVVPATDAVTPDPPAPLESIFRTHYVRLVALARLLLDRQVEAEEVVQEAFARVLARRGAGDTAATYVEATVVNLCRDGLRRRAVIRRVPATVGEDARPAEAVALGSAEQQRVVAAVRALPRRQRERVALRHLLGRSTTETASRARHRRGIGQDPSAPRHGRARDRTGGMAMIDELVRDALESQVAPPPAPGVWPRIDRAGELARQRRRRARVVTVAAVSVVALVAVAVALGALRSDGSGTRITVTTSPPPMATPSVAAATVRLPTVADWKRPAGYALGQVALSTARVADGGRALVIYWSGGGVCDEPQASRVRTSTERVSVELVKIDQGPISCPALIGNTSFLVRLPEPLGHREVVDATTGRPVALLDNAPLLVPTILLPGWSAQTEGLTDHNTWTRCYGPARCDYQGPAITTAQGSDVDDVLSASLDNFDDLTMQPATFVPSLAQAVFAYGSSSQRHGQLIPAADKISIEVAGTDGVILTSWANFTVLWHVGSTWYAASTPRHGSVTGSPTTTGVGIPELIHFARGLVPAG